MIKVGERGRNRTFNLLIKSQLLCQLSYAPVSHLSGISWEEHAIAVETLARANHRGSRTTEASSHPNPVSAALATPAQLCPSVLSLLSRFFAETFSIFRGLAVF